jgi:large subunit ribosomal protein L11
MKQLRILKLEIAAGQATSGPPLGPVLGQFKIPMMEFCKDFNEKTKHFKPGIPLKVLIVIYSDNTYNYIVKLYSIANCIKSILNLASLNGAPGNFFIDTSSKSEEILHNNFGVITPQLVYEIALLYYNIYSYKSLVDVRLFYRTVLATIRSMGVFVSLKDL